MTKDQFPMTIGGEMVRNERTLLASVEGGRLMMSPKSVKYLVLHLFCIPVSEKPHLLPICSKSIIMVQNSKIWNRKRTFICFSVLFLAIISKPCRQKMRFRLSCADN